MLLFTPPCDGLSLCQTRFRACLNETRYQANIGSLIIHETFQSERNNGCFCHLENGEVLEHVVKELRAVIGISKGGNNVWGVKRPLS